MGLSSLIRHQCVVCVPEVSVAVCHASFLPCCASVHLLRLAWVNIAGLGKKAGSAGQAVVKQLGKQRVNNLFTHLRKIAQHPLLVRNLYTEAQVERLVTVAHRR